MATVFSTETGKDGLVITGAVSSDDRIAIPDTIDGAKVTKLGSRFLRGIQGKADHTLIIPSSVRSAAEDALELSVNIRHIVYDGDFGTFSSFCWYTECECEVICNDMAFQFPANHHISFPAFDREMLSSNHTDFDRFALKRLSEPMYLEQEFREGYRSRMRDRSLRIAQHAVTSNDTDALIGLFDADVLSDSDLSSMLRFSLSSGRVPSTSVIMSEINRRHRRSSRVCRP